MFTWLKVRRQCKRLSRGDFPACQDAANALVKLRAVKPLIKALGNARISVRQYAATALGELGDPRAVEHLIKALYDRGEQDGCRDVIRAAGEALVKIGGLAVEPLIKALGDGQSRVAWILGKLGDPRAVEPLIKAMGDVSEFVRAPAADALAEFGDARAVEPMIKALGDVNKEVRQTAARALEKLGDPRAEEPLLQALGDVDQYVRLYAALALEKLGGPRAVEPLIKALRDVNEHVRGVAARRLGQLGDPRAVEPLIKAMGFVRSGAAEALGHLGGPRAMESLINALGNPDWELRGAAATGLGKSGDTRAVDLLIKALGDQDESVRARAAEALGKLGDPRAVEPLIRALERGGTDGKLGIDFAVARTVASAARALGTLADPRAVEPLIKALDEVFHDERLRPVDDKHPAAAEALGKLGDLRAVEPLIRALGVVANGTDEAAAEALARLGEVKWKPLIRGDGENFARLAASGDPRAVEPLIKALGSHRKLTRQAAAEGLKTFLARRSSAAISLSRWQHVRALITTPHYDDSSSECSHGDQGIGMDFPLKPPGGRTRKTDF